MDRIDEIILSALGLANQQISYDAVLIAVHQKTQIPLADFGARVRRLQQRGYINVSPDGRWIALTKLGADQRARSQRKPAGISRPVFFALVLFVFFVVSAGSAAAISNVVEQVLPRVPAMRTPVTDADATLAASGTRVMALTLLPLTPSPTVTPKPTATFTSTPTPTVTATPTEMPTITPTLAPQLLLQARADDRLLARNVAQSVRLPWIDPQYYPADSGFNQAVQDYATRELDEALYWLPQPLPDPGGFLTLEYQIVSGPDWAPADHFPYFNESPGVVSLSSAVANTGHEVISVMFINSAYFGGAHPGANFTAVNFDRTTGQTLRLDDLFYGGSPYLDLISTFCIQNLPRQTGYLFDDYERGLAPIRENYQVWAITRSGLLFVFQEYQVAPYAAGPQYVLIPYPVLAQMIDPRGPVGMHGE